MLVYSKTTLMVSNVTVVHVKECRLSCVSERVTLFKGSAVLCLKYPW